MKSILKKFLSESARARLRRVEQLAMLPIRRGSSLDCSCCGGSFRIFLHFYGNDGIRCPYCNSLQRQRFQIALLHKLKFIKINIDNILHIAPEFSLSLYIKKSNKKAYIRLDALKSFIPGICVMPDVVGDLCNLEFEAKKFKLIICNHVLEHIPDDRSAIKEIYRVLSNDGFALVTVPIRPEGQPTHEESWIDTDELRELHYGSTTHVRFYGLDIIDRFVEAGFFVRIEYPKYYFSGDQIERQRLDPAEAHFLLTKRDVGFMFPSQDKTYAPRVHT